MHPIDDEIGNSSSVVSLPLKRKKIGRPKINVVRITKNEITLWFLV